MNGYSERQMDCLIVNDTRWISLPVLMVGSFVSSRLFVRDSLSARVLLQFSFILEGWEMIFHNPPDYHNRCEVNCPGGVECSVTKGLTCRLLDWEFPDDDQLFYES
ncbi:hypothetical protein CEXT_763001 [Caerostris extrusa]|uniref:Uncharacterized protein n=1 Tax=Caerostris extrusa TaxID=172846 RepID=A0AAV4XWX8_CAEEX|nr:hypothetical protein CEXT_763001 [Caerostris extrusa]